MPFKPFRPPLLKMPLSAVDDSTRESGRHAKRRRITVEDIEVDLTRNEKAKSNPEISAVARSTARLGYRKPLIQKDNPPPSGTEKEGESASCLGVELYYNVLWYVLGHIYLFSGMYVK
jgi:DNA repair and recombination protein RAD54B